jgi:hypothetical protein
MRVLVVEDDRRIAADVTQALQAAGYVVETEPLATFVQRKGGINKCAERFPNVSSGANLSGLGETVTLREPQ